MKIGLLQMHVALSGRESNFRKVEELVERAMHGYAEPSALPGKARLGGRFDQAGTPGPFGLPSLSEGPESPEGVERAEKPDVLVLPELWDIGFISPRARELADEGGAATRSFLGGLAAKYGVNIVGGSICRKDGEGLWNTLCVFDRKGGQVLAYDKIHLFSPGDEARWFQPGENPGLCELDGVKAGFMTCYDLRFPELARSLALAGCKILFCCSAWPHPRGAHWRLLGQARAVENQVYFAGCNCTGQTGGWRFCGGSSLVDPWGGIVAEAGEEEGVALGCCDFKQQEQLRKEIPVFDDRRPSSYKL